MQTDERTIRIAIVDDQTLVRTGLTLVLESADDMQVVGEAPDPRGALDLVGRVRNRPDVVVLGLGLPDLDGTPLARRLCEEAGDVPVVVIGAQDDPLAVADAIRAGARAHMSTTAEPAEILQTLRMAARGKMVVSADVWSVLADGVDPRRTTGPPTDLSAREVEVLQLLAKGYQNQEIATELGISLETVKTHLVRIFRKLGVGDRTDAVAFALRANIIR
jgi:DNA-binding NarL/FixJ family response regulator